MCRQTWAWLASQIPCITAKKDCRRRSFCMYSHADWMVKLLTQSTHQLSEEVS